MANIWYCEDTGHWYQDIDGIRLVYEKEFGFRFPKLVGWYRPDGWGVQMPIDGYAAMVGEMLE